jgi:maltooligosyltrehalose trehalohydrolase
MIHAWSPTLSATYLEDGRCRFRVWAPSAQTVVVHLLAPREQLVPMEPDERGYHRAMLDGIEPGSLYVYRLDGEKERPDPASRFQPQGVHGPSQVMGSSFAWEDDSWSGLPLEEYVIYELHVGAFTPQGTFDAIIPHLHELKKLGVTAVELMPVTQFPGDRNWGYDGVYPYAVQGSYGGPEGLKRLVSACHRLGLAVILDVVYNHLGPEGNYLADFGPYFTDRYRTPWGPAVNFDGPGSDEVRHFFIENALYWTAEFHIDALRLDALHAVFDHSAQPFLEELAIAVHEQVDCMGRRVYLFAESDRNDPRVVRTTDCGGYGLDAHWNDDFHHALHTLLTGEQFGYYQDFGGIGDLAKAFRDGFVYSGQYSEYRQRRHGASSRDVPAHRLVIFAQNHDQVGNRMGGERLSQLVSFDKLKLAAGAVLLSPFIPLLFMGEEYGETAPFQYFTSHSDPALIEAVRRGRREEFAAFAWQGEPPDPADEGVFLRSKLNHALCGEGQQRALFEFYRELLRLRRELPALARLSKEDLEVTGYETEKVLFFRRWAGPSEVFVALNFGDAPTSVALPVPEGFWGIRLDSADRRWLGDGSAIPILLRSEGQVTLTINPNAFALFAKEA